MLDINDLAKKLNISRNTALKLVQSGAIRASKVGKQYRIKEENLDAFLTASEVTRFYTQTIPLKNSQANEG